MWGLAETPTGLGEANFDPDLVARKLPSGDASAPGDRTLSEGRVPRIARIFP